jgi:hypothetical protein
MLFETGAKQQQEKEGDCREFQDQERQGTVATHDEGGEDEHCAQDCNAGKSKPCFIGSRAQGKLHGSGGRLLGADWPVVIIAVAAADGEAYTN